jgi:large subunit ribosomal protein L6
MSRIGKLPIALPGGVTVTRDEKTNIVTVKGNRGELAQKVDPCISLEVENNELLLKRHTDQKRHRAMHGLYRALISNMVKGVSEGFTTVQELVGTGYKATATGQVLELSLGYSHNVIFDLPKEIAVETVTEKGKNPIIKLTCSDKQLLGQVATKIRSYRKPEPYKGKGIRFQGETVRRKAGKSADKK